jgi:hypothetical protein
MRTRLLVVLIVSSFASAAAQVSVSPPALFMTTANRFGTFIVENKSDEPQEISIAFRFGYPASDSAGQMSMQYADTTAERNYSLGPWSKGFPRRFVLPSGAQQIVRMSVQPPQDLPDGVYWSRIVTGAQAQAKRVDTVSSGITTQISILFEQITTVLYSKGAVTTSIEVKDPTLQLDSASVRLLWRTEKSGTAPYFGTITSVVRDEEGTVVDEAKETVGIYFSMNKFARFDRSKLKPGKYMAEITFKTDRTDIPANQIVQLPTITKKIGFTLP